MHCISISSSAPPPASILCSIEAAAADDVSTPPDSLVLYSISYLPTAENKDKAFAYLQTNPKAMMIDQTPCGKKLIALGMLDHVLPKEQIVEIWKLASKRLIAAASGNVTAFVDKADKRSVFRQQELPGLLKNDNVKTINGIDKFTFAQRFGD